MFYDGIMHATQSTVDLSSDVTELRMINSYICPGQEAVFRCRAHGGVTTIWRGSALENCSDGSIILRHSQFGSGLTINKTCGAIGSIVGQAITAENGSYISDLIVFAYQELNGSYIECAHDGEFAASRIQVFILTGAKSIAWYFSF